MSHVAQQIRKAVLFLILSFIGVGALAFIVISDVANFFVKEQAQQVAVIVGTFAKAARSVYTKEVVGKLQKEGLGASVDYATLHGFVPIPAQYLKMLGQATADTTSQMFQYRPISKWNIEPTQGLSNDFLQWAWPQLEAQDQADPKGPIDWKPVSRIEQTGGTKVMRFLTADPAMSQSCVDCHNNFEMLPEVAQRRKNAGVISGKQWKQHQLLGALEITVPLDRIEVLAAEQIKRSTLWISAILMGCLFLFGGTYLFNARRNRNMAKLAWQASHDALTELVNRRGFESSMRQLRELPHDEQREHALILIDLDGFKSINDTHGHQAGDEILKAVASSINTCCRVNDVVARLGGDEFAVLLPACRGESAYNRAEKIRECLEAMRVGWNGQELKIGASIGLTTFNGDQEDMQQVIKTADAACYAAKKAGKNKVVISER